MKLFCVQAVICTTRDGWTSTHQIPTFYLDGDQLGLLNEAQVEGFVEAMLRGIVGEKETVGIGVSVVEV